MTDYVNVEIVFVDGTDELVQSVSRENVADGVLHLFRRTGPLDERHLGSWPLVSIKRWRRLER